VFPELSLSLCVIVRDDERTIWAALESIKPWIDEMIVVDTGSTDATPDICGELGAQVDHFPWPDTSCSPSPPNTVR
jgi:glycosyltransferase involved in cell wall biosynthesis